MWNQEKDEQYQFLHVDGEAETSTCLFQRLLNKIFITFGYFWVTRVDYCTEHNDENAAVTFSIEQERQLRKAVFLFSIILRTV